MKYDQWRLPLLLYLLVNNIPGGARIFFQRFVAIAYATATNIKNSHSNEKYAAYANKRVFRINCVKNYNNTQNKTQ